jgi:hypothetical protein
MRACVVGAPARCPPVPSTGGQAASGTQTMTCSFKADKTVVFNHL